MRIVNEADILKPEIRKQIIEEIRGDENQKRKQRAYKRYRIFKDGTKDFVVEQLAKQFDSSTILEMSYSLANISICRKVIDKLARVYNHGCKREVPNDEATTQALNELSKKLDVNTELKKANKFLKLQKNLAFYIKPCPISYIDGSEQYSIKLEPMNPYLYDVVEHEYDRTKPMVYILSDFDYTTTQYTSLDAATVNRTTTPSPEGINKGDGKDQIIADSPEDQKSKVYIWWSDNFHFTTTESGEIISGESFENPIKRLPFVNFAIEQDGSFWAQGGDDLIDGSVLINSILTHNQHVAITQGYGQFYMMGKNLPRNIKIGPNKAILMEYDEGEPQPTIGYASASPQIDSLRGLVESYIALLLTTNNLSTSAVASQLGQSNLAPSGIAMIIDKAESMEDVQDQRQIFIDKEPDIWDIINRWLNLYGDMLIDELKGLQLPEEFELVLKFNDIPVVMSESEKLNNLKIRKELGLDTMIDLLMKDNPDLTKEQAEEKLKEILEEKMERAMQAQEQMGMESQEEKEEMGMEEKPEVESEDESNGDKDKSE